MTWSTTLDPEMGVQVKERCWHLHSIHACQSCSACGTGDPTRGSGEVGGGGELHLPRTDVTEGEGEGARMEALDRQAARASNQAIDTAIASSADIGGDKAGSGKEKARGVTGSSPRVPGASEEGPGGTSPLSPLFLAPVSYTGVLLEGFPVLGGGGFGSRRGASTAILSADCFSPDLRLCVLLCSFAAL